MNLIAAVDKHAGLGKKGELLFHIPEDMKNFKALTMGKTLVMGSATLRSLPGGKPLSGRSSIVLSHEAENTQSGIPVAHSLEELFSLLSDCPKDDVFVIGGASVYRQLLPYCDRAYITRVDAVDPEADCFLPDLDAHANWRLKEVSAPESYDGLRYCFCVYENDTPVPYDKGYNI